MLQESILLLTLMLFFAAFDAQSLKAADTAKSGVEATVEIAHNKIKSVA